MKVTGLCKEYNRIQRRSLKKEKLRTKFSSHLDKCMADREFESDEEKINFVRCKGDEYISGLGIVESIIIRLFINWLINFFRSNKSAQNETVEDLE